MFSDIQMAEAFLEEIRKGKPRYIRDQVNLIETSIKSASITAADKALEFCVRNRSISAVDLMDAIKHYSLASDESVIPKSTEITGLSEAITNKMATKLKIRDISEYVKIIRGSDR